MYLVDSFAADLLGLPNSQGLVPEQQAPDAWALSLWGMLAGYQGCKVHGRAVIACGICLGMLLAMRTHAGPRTRQTWLVHVTGLPLQVVSSHRDRA